MRRGFSRTSIWSSQQTLGRPEADKRFVQKLFPAPDIPTSAIRRGKAGEIVIVAISVRYRVARLASKAWGASTVVRLGTLSRPFRLDLPKTKIDGNIFFP